MEGFKQVNNNENEGKSNNDYLPQDKIRPLNFEDYIGQNDIKEHLKILIESAKIRDESLGHTLIYGQPGLGKTTLAAIIAKELGKNIVYTSAPAIEKTADLAGLLLNLNEGDVLFIDEIHGLKIQIEEMLYPAMEDKLIDITVPSARESKVIRLPLKNFTLIGATTRPGKLSAPLRDRFIVQLQLNYYEIEDLKRILQRNASILNLKLDDEAAFEIAKRSRGTARIANRFLDTARDYAVVKNNSHITLDIADTAMKVLKVDDLGLNQLDRKVIFSMYTTYKCRGVGVKSIATSIQEENDTIENLVEPYLLQKGLIAKTEKGRILTDIGKEYAQKLMDSGFYID